MILALCEQRLVYDSNLQEFLNSLDLIRILVELSHGILGQGIQDELFLVQESTLITQHAHDIDFVMRLFLGSCILFNGSPDGGNQVGHDEERSGNEKNEERQGLVSNNSERNKSVVISELVCPAIYTVLQTTE